MVDDFVLLHAVALDRYLCMFIHNVLLQAVPLDIYAERDDLKRQLLLMKKALDEKVKEVKQLQASKDTVSHKYS